MDRKTVELFRLALFGRLVMGVSHEVDNHLSVILGFAELIQVPGGGEKKAYDGAGKILAAGERTAAVIKHFSHYVRPHAPVAETFSVPGILSEIILFSRYDLGRGNVTFVMPEPEANCRIRGDSRDFALALLAILLNGAEAMAGAGGTLALRTARKGDGWDIAVSDEGPGIPREIMDRIFEEGFTTKPEPMHAGMGLPVARHILSGMGGTVAAENRESGGCEVTIRMPAST